MSDTVESFNPFEQFPPETREAVDGLMYLGHLESEFEFCGHNFVIRTLKTNEELLASQITKEYMESLGANRAWMAAQVALALVSVDYDTDFCPEIGPDPKAYVRARFNYVATNWYTPTIEFIFGKYAQLLQQQVLAIEAVSDLSNRDLPTSTPFADSSTEAGISAEETDGDIQT